MIHIPWTQHAVNDLLRCNVCGRQFSLDAVVDGRYVYEKEGRCFLIIPDRYEPCTGKKDAA